MLIFLSFGLQSKAQDLFYEQLADSALSLTGQSVVYDPAYFSISYPLGDIPADKGVCTDVIIRAYRKVGIDLQVKVHQDMKDYFPQYPNLWGLKTTDRNIDHRRVPNLMKFFERHGEITSISDEPTDYKPGDIVCWDLENGIKHIGLISNRRSHNSARYLVIHNIGGGQVLEDMLFDYKIIGHYRYK